MAQIMDNGDVSEAFAVVNGLKQDCVFAPTLSSLMRSAMLIDAYHTERSGNRIAYRTDSQLLNHRRMQFQSCAFTTTVLELIFAYDCALRRDMERGMGLFAGVWDIFGHE
nr:unnamed protein product [Spirometra erinaceieuropaei]